MQDDFTVFWRNNERAYDLFYDLLARSERGAYDDDFLAQLASYREAAPDSERADIFAARYLLAHNDPETAVICGERAYAKRPVNYEIWKILAVAYKALHREMDAIDMQGRAHGLYGSPQPALNLTQSDLREGLDRLSFARNSCFYAPTSTARAYIENGQLLFRPDLFIGEELPLTMPDGSARFWSAAYVEAEICPITVICSLRCVTQTHLPATSTIHFTLTCKRQTKSAAQRRSKSNRVMR